MEIYQLFAAAFVNLSLRYLNRLTGNKLFYFKDQKREYTNQIRSYLYTQLKKAETQVIRTKAQKIITKNTINKEMAKGRTERKI